MKDLPRSSDGCEIHLIPDRVVFPRIGAHRVRQSWHERFAETPDALKSNQLKQTLVPVLDLEIGADEFLVIAGP